jgi:hypothetical protein
MEKHNGRTRAIDLSRKCHKKVCAKARTRNTVAWLQPYFWKVKFSVPSDGAKNIAAVALPEEKDTSPKRSGESALWNKLKIHII